MEKANLARESSTGRVSLYCHLNTIFIPGGMKDGALLAPGKADTMLWHRMKYM